MRIKLFNPFKRKSISMNDLAYLLGLRSDEVINSPEEAVEKSAWVYSCVRAIATKTASVPWGVFKGDKRVEKVEAVIRQPNPFFTDIQMFQIIQAWKELRGIAFVYVDYPNIEILDTDFMQMKIDKTGISYTYYRFGEPEELDPEKVVFFQNFSPFAKFPPLSTLSASMSAVQLEALSQRVSKGIFQNGAVVPLVIKTETALSSEQTKTLKQVWEARYAGVNNAGHTPVLPPGVSVEKIGLSPVDMGILLFEKITKNRITTVFGVPPTIVNDTEHSDYAKSKVEERVFVRNTIIPKLSLMQREITQRLLPLIGGSGYEFRFLTETLPELKEDEKTKAETAHIYISDGLKTINEVRAEMKLEPVPWGNAWWGPLNMTELATQNNKSGKSQKILSAILHKTQEDKRILIWKNYIARTLPQENKLMKVLMKYWKKQEKFVLDYLGGKAFKFPKSWDELLAKTLKPYLLAFMQQAGDAQAAEFGITFDLQRPGIQRWLAAKVMTSAAQINETTKRDVLEQLKQAEENGEGIKEMSERIQNLFEQTYKNRARTVARTEVNAANNKAGLEAAKQAGMRTKEWLTAEDERVREWHAEADHQVVPIDEPFIVGGEEMMFPGDSSASAKNIVNCRCTMIYQ